MNFGYVKYVMDYVKGETNKVLLDFDGVKLKSFVFFFSGHLVFVETWKGMIKNIWVC